MMISGSLIFGFISGYPFAIAFPRAPRREFPQRP